MDKKRGKKGQFYLIAAIVIIAIIIGFAVVSNSPKQKTPVKIYDLKQELGLESQNVLDYGTYNELNPEQMTALLKQFVTEYVSYAGEGKNLYFIFGNSNKITLMSYQELAEDASITTGGVDTPLIICEPSSPCAGQTFTPDPGGHVKIRLGTGASARDYDFNLKSGENFYFVISQTIGGQTYVITS